VTDLVLQANTERKDSRDLWLDAQVPVSLRPNNASKAGPLGSAIPSLDAFDFELPAALAASEPPEARGLARDQVRLMVSYTLHDAIVHTRFCDLPEFLVQGDVLVVNTSATINAALNGWRHGRDGSAEPVALHLSSPTADGRWILELRRLTPASHTPLLSARRGETIRLDGGAAAVLVERLRPSVSDVSLPNDRVRLWLAEIDTPNGVAQFAAEHGMPIRYDYVPQRWPLEYYQTVFASEPGSAEMPSAGRPFTHDVIDRLERNGVTVAPLVLHTGVASLESHEAPYAERYRVPVGTAAMVNEARAAGRRIIAVGTTVVRALETVALRRGVVRAGEGWTDLVITPERGLRAVDAILTGFHAPRASHLAMLEAISGRQHLAATYAAALRHGYLWHEFGDVHLIMPGPAPDANEPFTAPK
jgi:S-adenosylmethionine:tRNA ribosyltransferase-isomerase